MKNQNFDPIIENRLAELQDVPARNPKNAARGRANFLSEVAKYQQAVSPRLHARQKGWMFPIRKEKFAMNALVSIIVAAAMVLGGVGTAAAAQNDLPTEPLYQVKLWTENASLAMAGDMETKANRLMEMTQTRVEEMIALAEMDVVPPEQVQQRLAQQLQQVLELCAGMEEPAMLRTLTQLRTRLQLQEQAIAQSETQPNEDATQLLTRTRQMLRTQLRLVEEGLADPQGFRYTIRNQMQYGQDEEATPEPNQQGEPGFHQNEDGGPAAEQPGNGNANGPAGGPNDESGEPQGDGSGSGNPDSGNPDSGTVPGGNGSGGNGSGGNGSGGNGTSDNGSGDADSGDADSGGNGSGGNGSGGNGSGGNH